MPERDANQSGRGRERLSVVVPCYNEQEVLHETASRLLDLMNRLQQAGRISDKSEVVFVDDGSRDRTWSLIEELSRSDTRVRGVKLSRNRGHQNALVAGLMSARGDAVVSIDADLQDDVETIGRMVERHHDGADIVYGVRSKRELDTWFKRTTAVAFYELMNWLGAESVNNHADFRLMSRPEPWSYRTDLIPSHKLSSRLMNPLQTHRSLFCR